MTTISVDRAAVAAALDRDEAYDRNPQGDPPLWVAGYRRALRATLIVRAATPADVPPTWVGREAEAYLAGHRDAVATVTRDIAVALGVRDAG